MFSVMSCSTGNTSPFYEPRTRPTTQHSDPFTNVRPSYTLRYETGMIEKNANPVHMQRPYQQPDAMEVGTRIVSALSTRVQSCMSRLILIIARSCACSQDNAESWDEEDGMSTPKQPPRSIDAAAEATSSFKIPQLDLGPEESFDSKPGSCAALEDREPDEWKAPKTVRLHGVVS